MTRFLQDVRFGMRFLIKHPGFLAVTVLTLAIGIGANTAVFSVINSVLLRPLPYAEPDRLVMLRHHIGSLGWSDAPIPPPDVVDYRTRMPSLESVAVTDRTFEQNLTGPGGPEVVRVATVSANFFDVLGIEAARGRTFRAEDGFEGKAKKQAPAVILSHRLWNRRFGAEPGIVGDTVILNGFESRVIGVLPMGFELLLPVNAGVATDIDIWATDPVPYWEFPRSSPSANRRVLARLAPGATLADVRREAETLGEWQRATFDYHRDGDISIMVKPLHEDIVAHVRPALIALFAAVLLVLLIACANTANLLLVQAGAREKEIAIRAAVGGGRRRIVRQFLTEAFLLAAIGGLAGLLLARWAIDLLLAVQPSGLPRLSEVPIDASVLLFTFAATVISALAFGVVPALNASRPDLNSCLKDRGACASNPGQRRLRHGIVIGEVALAMVLLVGAGLLFRSVQSLQAVDLGFEPDGVLTYRVSLPPIRYTEVEDRARALDKIEREIESLPGVKAVGSTQVLPLGGQFWTSPYEVELSAPGASRAGEADYRYVTPGFFEAFGARLLAGRWFEPADELKMRDVVVIDRALATRSWPGEDAIGREIEAETLFGTRQSWKVVGVVDNVISEGPAVEGRETIYFPYSSQGAFFTVTTIVRSEGEPKKLAGPIRKLVAGFDPDLPVSGVRTMESYVADATAAERFTSILIAVFAGIALLLAGIGLYGVVSAIARQRTREIGVMMAFGAGRPQILSRVVRRGLILSLVGLLIGSLAAVALTRLLASNVAGIPESDPITYLAVGALLLIVTLLASLVPASRAARTDPIEALRYE
ncbi:MAG: ABC transporter permease [marine benthic group bacterium]|nr:ABC transporter permease [Gemmatimonadota bacterium]